MPTPRQTEPTPALVPLCFFISGFAGLALEMVWSRLLALHVGGSAEAVTAVVTAYMAGLGLGSLIVSSFAARVRRPLRLYALLEIAVAAFALASPLIMRAPEGLYRLAHDREEIAAALPFAVRFATSLVLLMIPTLAMGATLPLLVDDLMRRGGAYASRVAMLYGINTVGAVAGTAVAGFILLPGFGTLQTLRVAAGLDLMVAVLLLAGPAREPTGVMAVARPRREDVDTRPALRGAAAGGRAALSDRRGDPAHGRPPSRADARGTPGRAGGEPEAGPPLGAFRRRATFIAFAVSGALAMIYELGWTRRLATLLGSSVYSFAILLATFLTGLGLGALLVGPFLRIVRRPMLALAAALGFTGVLALTGTALLNAVPGMLRDLLIAHQREPRAILAGELGLAALVLLPASLFLGVAFPLAARVVHRQGEGGGHAIGRAYAVNTAGTVLGAAGAGLFLLPALGSLTALTAAAWTHVTLGVGLALAAPGRLGPRLAVAGIVAALGVGAHLASPEPDLYRLNYGIVSMMRDIDRGTAPVPSLKELARGQVHPLRVLSVEEGRSATVAVTSLWGGRQLTINGKVDASDNDPTQVLLGQLPLILADSAKRVLVIGYGSGITTHSVLTHPVRRVETVELEPAVVRAGRFFSDLNGRDAHDPRSVIHLEDGRTHLAYTRDQYDVIVSEPSNPWIAGINNLFTIEFYRLVQRRLAPGGVFCQWIHGYEMSRPTLASLFGTLGQVFPGAEVYRQSSDFLVVWKASGAFPNRVHFERAFANSAARADLARVGYLDAADLFAIYLGPIEAVARREWRPNTDDNGLVGFRAPIDLLQRGDAEAWSAPALASLRLARYDPSAAPARVLGVFARGLTRRRDLERMIELEPLLSAAGAAREAEALRAEIARVAAGRRDAPRVGRLMAQSDAAFEGRDDERGAALLREALTLEPDNPDLLFRYGHALAEVGENDGAERALRASLEQRQAQLAWRLGVGEPCQTEIMLGLIARQRGAPDEAIVHFARARDINPYLTTAHQLLVATYEQMGRLDDARRAVAAGLATDPRDAQLREAEQRLREAH
jgi:spermidine synthase